MSSNSHSGARNFPRIRHVEISNHNKTTGAFQSSKSKGVNGFTTENAGGETYRHAGVEEVRERASRAGKQFFSIFEK